MVQQAVRSRSLNVLRLAVSRTRLAALLWRPPLHRSLVGQARPRSFNASGRGTELVPKPRLLQTQKAKVARCSMANIAEEGVGTHKPTAFQKRTMVLAKMYASIDKVPERVTRTQLAVAMDKFRVRVCIVMVPVIFIIAGIVAMVGRKERQQGVTVVTLAEARKKS